MKYSFCLLALLMAVAGCSSHSSDAGDYQADRTDGPAHASLNEDEQLISSTVDPASLRTMIEARGKLAANMANCGKGDGDKAKRETLQSFLKVGGTQQQFESYYHAGFDPVQRGFQKLSPAQQQQQCALVDRFLQQQRQK